MTFIRKKIIIIGFIDYRLNKYSLFYNCFILLCIKMFLINQLILACIILLHDSTVNNRQRNHLQKPFTRLSALNRIASVCESILGSFRCLNKCACAERKFLKGHLWRKRAGTQALFDVYVSTCLTHRYKPREILYYSL